jgi:SAM-dependent methyltransferase
MFSNDAKKAASFDYEGGDLEAMSQAEKYYRWILEVIRPHLGKHIVEAGAGVGSFSKLLKETEPKTLTLIEPAKRMHDQLAENVPSTKKTQVATINDYLKGQEKKLKGKVDTFVYINVFEHIEDDHAELKRINDMLQKGGHVIIFVPALQKLYSEFDKSIGHYRRYDRKRLQELADRAGMDVVKIRYMDMPGILPWWFSFVMMKRTTLVPSLVKVYDSFFVPVIKVFENTVQPPVGKNVLLVAKKR